MQRTLEQIILPSKKDNKIHVEAQHGTAKERISHSNLFALITDLKIPIDEIELKRLEKILAES